MKFSSSVFWEWHKVDNYVVMCRNSNGKPYTPPEKYSIISNIDNNYTKLGEIDRN